jgi:hypothetical protein
VEDGHHDAAGSREGGDVPGEVANQAGGARGEGLEDDPDHEQLGPHGACGGVDELEEHGEEEGGGRRVRDPDDEALPHGTAAYAKPWPLWLAISI